jgi:hypothetical protein
MLNVSKLMAEPTVNVFRVIVPLAIGVINGEIQSRNCERRERA